MHDLLLRNATVIDGTGSPVLSGDVAIDGARITAVEQLSQASGRRVIDVDGAVIAPGFIDLHTHCDFTLPVYPRAQSMVRQGVTTIVGGNCGFSPFPLTPECRPMAREYSAFLDAGIAWDWTTCAEYAAKLESLPLGCNVALQVGHGAVRIAAMGFERRAPTPAELERMQRLVAQAMEEGVFGISTGLVYAPSEYADTDELIALASVAQRYGAFYSSHIRGEGETLLQSVSEAITIGREAGVPVQLSHHKATGRAHWGSTEASLALIDEARGEGLDVLADQYPYTAGSTTLAALLPTWALEGGVKAMVARLSDEAARARIKSELTGNARWAVDAIMIASLPEGSEKRFEGMMLAEIAAVRGEDPVDTVLGLLEAHGGGVGMVTFVMSEEDVQRVMRHPAVAVASDGWILDPAAGGKPHPRSYGTYVRVLGRYVREQRVLSLEVAVRKMTGLPAQRLGRPDLGLIRPGYRADLVIFDPAQVAERATYENPHQFSAGVSHVVVNGQLVIEDGQDTGAAAGQVLRRGAQ